MGGCLAIKGHGGASELEIGTQYIRCPSLGFLDEPKFTRHTHIQGKGSQGFGLVAVQKVSFGHSMQNESIVFPGHHGHPVLFHTDQGSFIPIIGLGIIFFVHECLHGLVVHFLHQSFPKQAARGHRMFGTHNIFQFHHIFLGLKTDLSILPVDIFSRQIRHAEFGDLGMRIYRDHAIALSMTTTRHTIDRPVR